jgi:hypothetical protein
MALNVVSTDTDAVDISTSNFLSSVRSSFPVRKLVIVQTGLRHSVKLHMYTDAKKCLP